MDILVPEVESYLEGYCMCVKFHAQTLSSLGEISEKASQKIKDFGTSTFKH